MTQVRIFYAITLFFLFGCFEDVGKIYESVKKTNTVQGYEKFIADHHDSEYVDSAKLSLSKLEFGLCVTTTDFQRFVKKYSNSIYADSAQFILMKEEYAAVKESDEIGAFKSFLEKYPEGEFADLVGEKIKNLEEKAKARKYERSNSGIKKKVQSYLAKLDGRYGVKRGVYKTKTAYKGFSVKDGGVRITINCIAYGRSKALTGATVNRRILLQNRDYCKTWAGTAKKDIQAFPGVKSVVIIDEGG